MAKEKRPTWFKIHSQNFSSLNVVSDDKLGQAFKLAMDYFNSGAIDETIEQSIKDIEVKIAFATFKQNIDECYEDYNKRVEDGRRGQQVKQENQSRINQLLEQFGGDEKDPKPPLSNTKPP